MSPPQSILRKLSDRPQSRAPTDNANYYAVVFDAAHELGGMVAAVETLEPGCSSASDTCRETKELLFVLKGRGRAMVATGWVDIGLGDALTFPKGSKHCVENTGIEPLAYLTLLAPNEAFAPLISSGTPMGLRDESLLPFK